MRSLLVVFCLGCVANLPAAFAEEGFLKARVLAAHSSPFRLHKRIGAIVRLNIKKDRSPQFPSMGSGVFISNNGHLLTAMHLVQDDLLNLGLLRATSDDGVIFYESTNEKNLTNITLPNISIPALGLSAPKIVMIGLGKVDSKSILPLLNDFSIPLPSQAILEKMRINSEDFVILKFENKSKTSCIPFEEKPNQVGDKLWAVGFPAKFKRKSGVSADGGERAYVARGSVYSEYGDIQRRALTSHPREVSDPNEAIRRFSALENSPAVFLSSLDSYPGMSGAPVINFDGKLVGVNIGAPFSDIYLEGFTTGIRFSWIYNSMRQNLGTEVTMEALNCR